jgi:polyphenol oxidase
MYEFRRQAKDVRQTDVTLGVPEGGPMILTSALLDEAGFAHAFFTRHGGVSAPPWDSLSFAVSTGDDPAAVRENFARAARALGLPPEARVYVLRQVHRTAARAVKGDEPWDEVARSEGDIVLTGGAQARAGRAAVGVLLADCVPVLLADRRSGAVAAIHSGWRGTAANAARAGVSALRALASDPGDLLAAIGPHIEGCCFEVGPDVAEVLARASRADASAVLPGERPRVDLRCIVRAQLEAEGLDPEAIDDVRGCSVCTREPDGAPRFHSFRRDGTRSGRLLSAILPALA